MVNIKTLVLIATGAIVAASSPALAQRWGREAVPRAGACFYQHSDYRGDYFCTGVGENVGAVPEDMNDRISSIRIFGTTEVTVFKDIRFSGGTARFDRDIRDLQDEGWNDRISSFRVRSTFNGSGGQGGRGGGFSGNVDQIVRRAYQDILDREPDFEGLRTYRGHIIEDGWSEARVREELRRSPEYREKSTMTRAKAEEIVRRAYLAVLRREPDPGSRDYVDRVLRDHATQEDIERELRESAEYRNRNR
jgi:peptidase inhibitor family I36